MQLIFGTLSIDMSQLISSLDPGKEWLLMSGFPDPNQAGIAATHFILNVKHLSSGVGVALSGTRNTIGTQPVIIMTDINAAGGLMDHAMKLMATAQPLGQQSKTAGRKSRAKKKSASRKPAPQSKTKDQV
jgi:hypothetical protein